MTDSRSWLILVSVAGGGVLLFLLAPVLTPFLVSALLAYMGDPLVDRLEGWFKRWKLSRTWAVMVVFLVLSVMALLALMFVLPLLGRQLGGLVASIPGYIDWIQHNWLPSLQSQFGLAEVPDLGAIKKLVVENWSKAGGAAMGVFNALSSSGMALVGLLANLVLIPVVTFYLLRDWDVLVAHLHALLPRRMESTVAQLARDADEVLAAFMRGQLMVMLALGTIYSIGLWIIGVDYAVLIGMTAGLVSFVPYLGMVVGLGLAGVVTAFQFQDGWHLLYVAIVFGVGQFVESVLLTPLLVGDRIGLHPVAVIFAVLAFGQLFGFFGVLLALPAAAVVMVILRYAHGRYVGSELYVRS